MLRKLRVVGAILNGSAPRFLHAPHAFEIVIGAYLGAEHVHDHIACIDQGPIALHRAGEWTSPITCLFQLAGQPFGDRSHMPRGTPACNHQCIGDRGTALKIDGDDIFRLVGVERGNDSRKQRLFFFLGTGGPCRYRLAYWLLQPTRLVGQMGSPFNSCPVLSCGQAAHQDLAQQVPFTNGSGACRTSLAIQDGDGRRPGERQVPFRYNPG